MRKARGYQVTRFGKLFNNEMKKMGMVSKKTALRLFSLPGLVLVLLVWGFCLYGPALNAPFIGDDHELILQNPAAQSLRVLGERASGYKFKLLTLSSFVFNFTFGGRDPLGFHLVNLILHGLAALGLAVFVRELSGWCTRERPSAWGPSVFSPEEMAFWAALVFLCHPVQTSAVTYIWQRSEVLSGVFYLWGLAFYVRARLFSSWGDGMGVAVCFGLGMVSKGVGVTLPLMMGLTEALIFSQKSRRGLWVCFGGMSLCLALFFFFLWFKGYSWANVDARFMHHTGGQFSLSYFWTELALLPRYAALALFPWDQRLEYDIVGVATWRNFPTVAGLVFVTLMIGGSWLIRRRWPLVSWGIILFFVYLIPTSTFIKREPFWEHRLYVSLAGVAVGIVEMVSRLKLSVKGRRVVLAGIIGVFSLLTVSRNLLWRDPVALLEDTVRKSPSRVGPWVQLGLLYAQQGKRAAAEAVWQKALRLDPTHPVAANNLGLLYDQRGEREKARRYYQIVLSAHPDFVPARVNVGYGELRLGNFTRAREIFEEGLRFREDARLYLGLAQVALALGRWDDVERWLSRAERLDPFSVKVKFAWGQVKERRGQKDEALRFYRQALELRPVQAEVLWALGECFLRWGDDESAREVARRLQAAPFRMPSTDARIQRLKAGSG